MLTNEEKLWRSLEAAEIERVFRVAFHERSKLLVCLRFPSNRPQSNGEEGCPRQWSVNSGVKTLGEESACVF